MRLITSLNGLGATDAETQIKIDALKAQLPDLLKTKASADATVFNTEQAWNANHFGGVSYDQYMGFLNPWLALQRVTNAKIDDVNTQIASLSGTLSSSAAAQTAQAQTPESQVESFRRASFLMTLPGYDYGKGSTRRNDYFKGLGDNMTPTKTTHSLYNLWKRDGLNDVGDIFADIISAAKAGGAAVKAEGSAPKLNLGPSPIQLPSWLTTFVGAAAKTVGAKKPTPTTGTIATGGAQKSTVVPAYKGPNYLAWGAAGIALLGMAVVLRRKS